MEQVTSRIERQGEYIDSREWATRQAAQLNAECEADIERIHGKAR